MYFIDTHAHLDYEDYKKDFNHVMDDIKSANVGRIIIPGADPKTLNHAINLSNIYKEIYFCAGLHPLEIKDNINHTDDIKQLMEIFKQALIHPKCIAVGESGLDYYYYDDNKELQEEIFRLHINLAIEFNKPLIIHSRNKKIDELNELKASVKIASILKEYKGLQYCLHCFGGDLEFMDLDTYFGVGGIISFKNNAALREGVKSLPIERIVLETDSPYLSPHPRRGKRNDPSTIPIINRALAEILGVSEEFLRDRTTKNASKLFKIN